uniref:NADH dehydrogenase subunit 2 n=1 Tax=Nerita costata TaxID=55015 RepID=UPI0022383D7F|nr:NADH dehydrogenase subunit 2 [Nerita costata]UYI29869.1 NADH dehydrogenase subunit 2 [Nerita costata]
MLHFLPYGFGFLWLVGFGTIFSVSASHWLGAWAGLEINLIGFVPILLYRGMSVESESTMKYLVVQALGSSLLLFGSLSVFGESQGWGFGEVGGLSLSLSCLVIFLGLMMKLGVFPFHFWLPSVMSGLSWFGCMVLATWQKLAPIFLMGCLLEGDEKSNLVVMAVVLSCLSALAGGVGGLNQTQFRALLAYSSIVHLGWLTYCLTCHQGALKLYLFVYVVTSVMIFGILLTVEMNTFGSVKKLSSEKLMTSIVMTVILLSLAGMPPLLGFSSKWVAINCGVYLGSSLLGIGVLVVGSLMSLFYYLSLCYLFIFSLYDLGLESSGSESFAGMMREWFKGYSWMFLFVMIVTFLGGLPIVWSSDFWLGFF